MLPNFKAGREDSPRTAPSCSESLQIQYVPWKTVFFHWIWIFKKPVVHLEKKSSKVLALLSNKLFTNKSVLGVKSVWVNLGILHFFSLKTKQNTTKQNTSSYWRYSCISWKCPSEFWSSWGLVTSLDNCLAGKIRVVEALVECYPLFCEWSGIHCCQGKISYLGAQIKLQE